MALSAQTMVDRYLEAEQAVLDGKEIQFGGRKVTMVDLEQIRKGRQEWERRLAAQQSPGRRPFSLAEFR